MLTIVTPVLVGTRQSMTVASRILSTEFLLADSVEENYICALFPLNTGALRCLAAVFRDILDILSSKLTRHCVF